MYLSFRYQHVFLFNEPAQEFLTGKVCKDLLAGLQQKPTFFFGDRPFHHLKNLDTGTLCKYDSMASM